MSVDLLGEGFRREFNACGHREVDESGARDLLRRFHRGDPHEIHQGLHTLAGHPSAALKSTLQDHRRNVAAVAREIASGSLDVSTLGNLLAGSQFQTSRIGAEVGSPVSADSVSEVYHAALGSDRVRDNQEFRSWMIGTTLASLRLSTHPAAATELLAQIVQDAQLVKQLEYAGPSQLRYVVILAAPKLCMRQLFPYYGKALAFGGAEERGVALVHVAQLPTVVAQLSKQSRALPGEVLDWAHGWSTALEHALAQPNVSFLSPPSGTGSQRKLIPLGQVRSLVADLQRIVGAARPLRANTGELTAQKEDPGREPSVSSAQHICGPQCAVHRKSLIVV
jgi:hypothetical protein